MPGIWQGRLQQPTSAVASAGRPDLIATTTMASSASSAAAAAAAADGSHCENCCVLGDISWIFGWIIYTRRASFVLLMLSGIVLYCVPETRSPAKRGCHFVIDALASGLKAILGGADERRRRRKSWDEESEPRGGAHRPAEERLSRHRPQHQQQCVSFDLTESELLRERRRQQQQQRNSHRHRHRESAGAPGGGDRPRGGGPGREATTTRRPRHREKSRPYAERDATPELTQRDAPRRQNYESSLLCHNGDDPYLKRCYEKQTTNFQRRGGKRSLYRSRSYFGIGSNGEEELLFDFEKDIVKGTDLSFSLADKSEVEISEWTDSDFNQYFAELNNHDKKIQSDSNTYLDVFSRNEKSTILHGQSPAGPVNSRMLKSKGEDEVCNSFAKYASYETESEIEKHQSQFTTPKKCCKLHSSQAYKKSGARFTNTSNEESSAQEEDWTNTNSNRSFVLRAYDWIFGGCPSVRELGKLKDKRLSTLVKRKLTDLFGNQYK